MTKNVNKNSNKNIINIKIGDTKKRKRKSKSKEPIQKDSIFKLGNSNKNNNSFKA
jgi:hypothetical protein